MKDRRGLPRRAAAAGYTHRLLDAVKSVDIATTRAESATMRANDVATIAERLPRLRKARRYGECGACAGGKQVLDTENPESN